MSRQFWPTYRCPDRPASNYRRFSAQTAAGGSWILSVFFWDDGWKSGSINTS